MSNEPRNLVEKFKPRVAKYCARYGFTSIPMSLDMEAGLTYEYLPIADEQTGYIVGVRTFHRPGEVTIKGVYYNYKPLTVFDYDASVLSRMLETDDDPDGMLAVNPVDWGFVIGCHFRLTLTPGAGISTTRFEGFLFLHQPNLLKCEEA